MSSQIDERCLTGWYNFCCGTQEQTVIKYHEQILLDQKTTMVEESCQTNKCATFEVTGTLAGA